MRLAITSSVLAPKKTAISTALPGLVLVAATVAAYWNSLGVPFLLDDHATLQANPSITRLWPLSTVLFPPGEMYTAGRPLLNLSFALNHAISGTSVGGYHVTNLAIHVAAALVFFGIVRRTLALPRFCPAFNGSASFFAFAAAALWALHPLQTVSVTYLSQRAESLMGLFYLLTLYCFIRGTERGAVRWMSAAVVTCALGLATKEVMVTAPLVVFLYDWQCVAGTARGAWQQRWRTHAALGATWLLLGGLMIGANLSQRAIGLGHNLSRFDYLQLECRAIVHYLQITVWPHPLIFDHGPDLPKPTLVEVITQGGLIVSLIGLSLFGLWRGRMWGFLGCIFFLLLAPTSSVIPIAGQPIAENRMYLPLASVLLIAAGGLQRVLAERSRAPFGGVLILSGLLSWARNADYRTEIEILSDTVAKQPANGRAWYWLSTAHAGAGQPSEALQTMIRAVHHRPNDAALRNNLAVAFYTAGRMAEAKLEFEKAIQLNPGYAEALYNLGALLYQTGQFGPALQAFQRSLQIKPGSAEAENYAGLCARTLGDIPLAVRHFQRAVEIDPQHQAARANLQQALSLRR